VHSPSVAAALLGEELRSECVEAFAILVLDARHRVLLCKKIHRGGIDHCAVDPREVFRPAVLLRASALVVGHNHPSGDSTPSQEDFELTSRLKSAADALGIAFLDHLIFAGGGSRHWVSLAEGASLGHAL